MSVMQQHIEALASDLVEQGIISDDQLVVAKEARETTGKDLANILVSSGYISEKDLIRKLGKKYGVVPISLKTYTPDATVLSFITPQQAHAWKVIPLFEIEGKLTAVTSNPFNFEVLDELTALLDMEVDFVMASEAEVNEALNRYYEMAYAQVGDETLAEVEIVNSDDYEDKAAGPVGVLEEEAKANEVVETTNRIISMAFRQRASDIHLEPSRDTINVRLRIDGVLIEAQKLPKTHLQAILSRIKIMANMDVAERRKPQDGRVRVRVSGHELDLRIASYSTIYGEACAIRLLAKENVLTLSDLGLLAHDQAVFSELIKKPFGMFLVTGPTGSGKSTSLYAALQEIDRKENHVLSVEDPVENEIQGVSQIQINTKAGIIFADVLKAMLRQDPDIIMLGEIRDVETAEIALRAALTGHQVMSTLHTNSAVGAFGRLHDMGVERFLISSTINGVLAQRLARKICKHCKEEYRPDLTVFENYQNEIAHIKTFYRGKGCKECRMTGYRGRVGLFELIRVDEEMRALINRDAKEIDFRNHANKMGGKTIFQDGIFKVEAGLTTIEEVIRLVGDLS